MLCRAIEKSTNYALTCTTASCSCQSTARFIACRAVLSVCHYRPIDRSTDWDAGAFCWARWTTRSIGIPNGQKYDHWRSIAWL